jgi:DNA-nicking Smr family endonuclease
MLDPTSDAPARVDGLHGVPNEEARNNIDRFIQERAMMQPRAMLLHAETTDDEPLRRKPTC